MYIGSRLALFFLWLIHWLPLWVLSPIGVLLGKLLYRFAGSRRAIALRNLELCFPEKNVEEREQLVKQNFEWLARSVLERSILFYGSERRLRRLITIEGDPKYADNHPDQAVMWLVPHFMALDVAAFAARFSQNRRGVSIYQEQSNPIMDAAVRKARLRFDTGQIFTRKQGLVPVMRAIRRDNVGYFNLPDQDLGRQDAEFVPFFGVPAATLTAPSRIAQRMDMKILPIIAEILPGSKGYKIYFPPPLEGIPTDDAYADTLAINKYLEQEILKRPSQYLWVHRRFKTRPDGEPSLYE